MLRLPSRLNCYQLLIISFAVVISQILMTSLSLAVDNSRGNDRLQPEKILFHREFKTPQIVSGQFQITTAETRQDKAYDFFAVKNDLFKINTPRDELELIKETTDNLGMTHLRFQQRYQGLRIWGCQTIVHFSEDNSIFLTGGQTIPTPTLSADPTVDEARAVNDALSNLQDINLPAETEVESELIIYHNNGDPKLAWMITITSPIDGSIRWRIFMDAQTDNVLHKFNDIHFDGPDVGSGNDIFGINRTFPIYLRTGEYQMIDATRPMYVPPIDNLEGVIVTYVDYHNGGSVSTDDNGDKVWDGFGQSIDVSGHYNSVLSYEYFYNTFGRNSIDDNGMTVLVNIHDPTYTNNAYWNGEGINFGDGDGTNFLPFAGALDIVAHELTHGVTEFTAGLIYQYEQGALSEHFSDFFGAMVDRDDWTNAESITLFDPGHIRSMEDPTLRGHPKHMNQYINHPYETDNGGVHINCGIPNHAAYWACTFIGREIGEQIWYRNLTTYMTPLSDFFFWAGMTLQSTKDLYGQTEIDAVNAALDTVGLNTAYVRPEVVQATATIGTIGNNSIFVHNPGPGTKQVTAVAPTIPGVTISPGPGYQEYIPEDGSSEFILSLDATSLGDCDIGTLQDSLRFDVVGSINTQIRVPLTANVGINVASERLSDIQTPCLAADVNNTTAMTGMTSGDQELLAGGSFMVGWSDGGETRVYRDAFATLTYTPVDEIYSSDQEQSFRYSGDDARIQGSVKYIFVNDISDSCEFIIAEYTITNPCNYPTTVYSGVLFDFNISGDNDYGDYDAEANMTYIYDEGDNAACGLALLDGDAYNMRSLGTDNIWNSGLSDLLAYGQLTSINNLDGYEPGDWTILLSFGDDLLNSGDTAVYVAAILYSSTGTAGLADVLAKALAWYNRVPYICGDANGDDGVNIGDVVYITNHVFRNGECSTNPPIGCPPDPYQAGDVNCDESVNIGDAVYVGNVIFRPGSPDPCAGCPVR